MPLMTNKRGNANRDYVTYFVSVAYTDGETYSFPDTNNRLSIRNSSANTLTLVVAGVTYTIAPFKTQLITADYTQFTISADVNSSAFECTSIIDNPDDAGAEVDLIKEQLDDVPNRYRSKDVKLEQTDLSPTLLQQMAGDTPINSIPQDKSVTPLKTTFINIGKNLFNKDTVTPNTYIKDDNGQTASFSNMSASDFIDFQPNTQYTRNYLSPYSAFYDINKNYISAIPNTNTFTTPSNCYHGRVTVSPSSNVDGYQLEQGSAQTSYEKFKYILDEAVNVVPQNGKVNLLYPDYLMQSMTLKYHGDNWNGIGESGFLFNPFLTKNDKKISFKLGSNFQIFFFEIGSEDVLDINSKKLFLNMKLLSHALNTFTLGIVVQGWDGTQYTDISTTTYFDLVSETTKEVRLSYTINTYYSKIAVKFLWNNGTNDVGRSFDILDFIPYSNTTDIGIYTTDDLAKTFKSDAVLVEKDMPHYGKTYSAIGDSITAIDGMYTDIISSICKFGTVNNYGVGGTCLTKLSDGDNSFVDRLPSMTNLSKSDIVSVFGGTNDINNLRAIGTLGNNNVATFIGALEYIINYIYTQNVNAKIILITPFRSKIVGGVYDNTNSLGLKMKDYADAVKLVGQTYSLPVVDLYNECGCNTKNINVLTSDGVHPVKNFSFRIANMIGSKINSI